MEGGRADRGGHLWEIYARVSREAAVPPAAEADDGGVDAGGEGGGCAADAREFYLNSAQNNLKSSAKAQDFSY